MARAYYSTTFEHSAGEVWGAIRDFGRYEWADGVSDSAMENGQSGDSVGGIRSFFYAGQQMRQRLLAHSDVDRFYTFGLCEESPMRNYRATLMVTPITDGDGAFVEWWATFDCELDETEQWTSFLEQQGFPVWLGSLPAHLAEDARLAGAAR